MADPGFLRWASASQNTHESKKIPVLSEVLSVNPKSANAEKSLHYFSLSYDKQMLKYITKGPFTLGDDFYVNRAIDNRATHFRQHKKFQSLSLSTNRP